MRLFLEMNCEAGFDCGLVSLQYQFRGLRHGASHYGETGRQTFKRESRKDRSGGEPVLGCGVVMSPSFGQILPANEQDFNRVFTLNGRFGLMPPRAVLSRRANRLAYAINPRNSTRIIAPTIPSANMRALD
jgi:hypothetical protein